MLKEYEKDHPTGMDIGKISELIYNRTSGYPYLVSSLCKYVNEEITGLKDFPSGKHAWTENREQLCPNILRCSLPYH